MQFSLSNPKSFRTQFKENPPKQIRHKRFSKWFKQIFNSEAAITRSNLQENIGVSVEDGVNGSIFSCVIWMMDMYNQQLFGPFISKLQ